MVVRPLQIDICLRRSFYTVKIQCVVMCPRILIACPHCRRKVGLSHKSETVAENGEIRRQSHFCATVSLFCGGDKFLGLCWGEEWVQTLPLI